jgi:hypothetical protein
MSPFRTPILVRLKDCGEMERYNFVLEMQNFFEEIDIENEEYEAWDATDLPLKLSVQKAPAWLRVEPGEKPAREQLANAIREFARIEDVPMESSALEMGDFPRALEQVLSAVRSKWQARSWWQRFKRRF